MTDLTQFFLNALYHSSRNRNNDDRDNRREGSRDYREKVKNNTAMNGFSNYKSNGYQNGDYKSSEYSSNRGFRSRSREGRSRRGELKCKNI